MNINAFKGLEGKKLSVLLNKIKPSGTPESYVVYLNSIGDGYVVLDYSKASYDANQNQIEQLIIDVSIIESIWVYKEGTTKKKKKLATRDSDGLGYPATLTTNT